MTDHLPTRLTDDVVSGLPLSVARQELLEEIMSTPVTDTVDPATRPPRRTRGWAIAVAAAAAVALVVAVPLWTSRDDGAKTVPDPRYAGPGSTGERAVLAVPGWSVEYVAENAEEGEIAYAAGAQRLDVMWRQADQYDDYLTDRERIGDSVEVDLFGDPSPMWAYSDDDHTTIGPVNGNVYFEVRGEGMDEAAYRTLLGQLERVDPAGFEASLPPNIVTPSEQDATIAEMLSDITVPDGFDPKSITVDGYNERYQVGAPVTGKVTCAWIRAYADAQAAGDQAGEAEAAAAMDGSRDWAVLQEMADQGDWSDAVRDTADLMVAGKPARQVTRSFDCGQGQ